MLPGLDLTPPEPKRRAPKAQAKPPVAAKDLHDGAGVEKVGKSYLMAKNASAGNAVAGEMGRCATADGAEADFGAMAICWRNSSAMSAGAWSHRWRGRRGRKRG